MHGVVKFDPRTGVQQKSAPAKAGSYTNYFADALIAEAERDSRIVAIHAAMAGGTGEHQTAHGVMLLVCRSFVGGCNHMLQDSRIVAISIGGRHR